MGARAAIMALPPSEQLDAALYLLEELTGQGDRNIAWLKQAYGLTQTEAVILAALNAAHPRMLTKDQLYLAVYGGANEVGISIVDIYVCRLRGKIGKDRIRTVWGDGYALAERIEVPNGGADPQRHALPWTAADDAELRRMAANGSEHWAIAEELGRSERAVGERLRTRSVVSRAWA